MRPRGGLHGRHRGPAAPRAGDGGRAGLPGRPRPRRRARRGRGRRLRARRGSRLRPPGRRGASQGRGRAGAVRGRDAAALEARRLRPGRPLPGAHRGDPRPHLRGVVRRLGQPRLREPAAARDDGLLAGGVAGRAGHVGEAAAPGGPRAGAAPVPRGLRGRGAIRLRVPHPRPRGAHRVVAGRGPGAAGARRQDALRPRVRARHHRAAAGRGVSPQASLLRPADRPPEPRPAAEPPRAGARRVRCGRSGRSPC